MDTYAKNILYFLNIYRRRWFLILLIIGASITFSAVNARQKPLVYRSTVTVLNIAERSQIAMLGKSLGLSGLPEYKGGTYETIMALLQSRRMSADVQKRFNPEGRPGFWWQMSVRSIPAGFAVDVKGPDPDLTAQIANFMIENLDKINEELQVSADKPMVKMLDPALKGGPGGRNVSQAMLTAGAFAFLACSCFFLVVDYFKTLKGYQAQ